VPHSTDALFASVGWGAVICARPVVL
jgi:hypothetical protein